MDGVTNLEVEDMMIAYLVRKVEICPVCGGDGYYPNPDWQEINEANNEWMKAHGLTTFTDEARTDWEKRIKERWPHTKPPPEEEFCSECEGAGKIESWISLLDALIDLDVYVPEDWAERAEAK